MSGKRRACAVEGCDAPLKGSREFRVSASCISGIVGRRTWKEVS